jgi:hypothetical protein
MSDDKMVGHVSALQLLLGDWDPYTVRRAINLAFPDTFAIQLLHQQGEGGIELRIHLSEAVRAVKELGVSMDGSSGLGAVAVRNLKPLIDQATNDIIAAQQRLGYKTK